MPRQHAAHALRAENARLRAQLDASEQAARITELQEACTRHEAAAREARAALRGCGCAKLRAVGAKLRKAVE